VKTLRILWWYIWSPLGVLGGLFLIIGLCLVMSSRETDKRCGEILSYARTTRDTLDAKIACARIRSDQETAQAIGIAGGLTAGAIAGSAGR
jgi:hypothetical protein